MNHINNFKIFENISDFNNTIKDYFSDLIDDSLVEIEFDEEEVIIWASIKTNFRTTNINDFLKSKEKEMNILKGIKLSLERISSIYDVDVDCEFDMNESDYQIVLRLTPGIPKEGEFYKETKHGIKINYSKLEEILKLKNVMIFLSSTGSSKRLNFEFKSDIELEKYKDRLIEDFMKLKIGNRFLYADIMWSSSGLRDDISPYKIFKNYKVNYRRGGEKTKNSIEFGLNSEIEFTW